MVDSGTQSRDQAAKETYLEREHNEKIMFEWFLFNAFSKKSAASLNYWTSTPDNNSFIFITIPNSIYRDLNPEPLNVDLYVQLPKTLFKYDYYYWVR